MVEIRRVDVRVSVLRALVSGVTVFAWVVPTARGAMLTVKPDGSGDFPTIQGAVDGATTGDEVLLGDGVFRGQGNCDVVIYRKLVSIRSESGDPARCTVECAGTPTSYHRGFHFVDTGPTAPVLEGVTVRGGWFDIGGAMLMWQSSVNVRRCVFSENVAEEGGALLIQAASPLVEDCVFAGNRSTTYPGGGIFCGMGGAPTLQNCTIVANDASSGAAVAAVLSTSVTVQSCIMSGNIGGEALFCDATGSIQIACSDVFGNAGGDWVGCVAGQGAVNANFSLPPMFCSADHGAYTLQPDSPCAPPGATGCGLVGALPVGDPCDAVGLTSSTWGMIKARFR